MASNAFGAEPRRTEVSAMARIVTSQTVPPLPAPRGRARPSVRRLGDGNGVERPSVLEVVISALALALFSPLFGVIALLIKLTSRGPVFYRGERVGQGFRPFTIYKFRTMLVGTETQIGARLLGTHERYLFCTPLGRLLKRTKLDELPQLLNVVKGEMRLVGPRPVRPVFIKRLLEEVPGYAERFQVPPGITGIAQLRGGYYTSPRNKLRYDLAYIRNRSALLDLRLLILTFVKILDRWLSTGMFVLFLFLLVSFVPVRAHPVFRVPGLGFPVDGVSLALIGLSVWVLLKVRPAPFSLYRSPINVPIALFIVVSLLSATFAEQSLLSLQGSAYYAVTGFLTAFLIVNTLATTVFITWTVRVIALTSAVISLLGLFETFAVNVAVGAGAGGARAIPVAKISSILDNPVELAVYLVLGMPLLLAEVTSTRDLRLRDFWLVCATISFVGVFLTQTRVGLLALLVSGALFLCRRRSGVLAFVSVFLLCILLLVSMGLPRFAVPDIIDDMSRRFDERAMLFQRSPVQWLIGSGAAGTAELIAERQADASAGLRPRPPALSNMHLTLILEHGIVGWLLVMWIVIATIVAIARAYRRARDERLKTLSWAILSSLAGYLVSMASMNTFQHLPIQVFFWSLIGIGLGLAARAPGPRRHNVIWRFGDAGDR
jgi:lipopolysaccharide/colanic/teichoic acid biosynthesis glycosyltransferase